MPHAHSLLVINRASLFYAIAVKLIVATFSLPLLSLILSCFLAGEDGQTLPINRRQRAYNNGTLIIEQLQRLEDAGTYTCMAQNKQKQTSRRNVEIQVLGEYCVYVMWELSIVVAEHCVYARQNGVYPFIFCFPLPIFKLESCRCHRTQ